jgi:predicted nucleotidyltransferase
MESYLFKKGIDKIAYNYNILFIVYFGSYQTKYYNSESDIDIAFLSSNLLDNKKRINLLEELILYHRKSEIDLVDLKTAEPILRYEIAKNGRVLFEKEEGLFERYSLFYIKRYYELKPVINEGKKNVGKKIMEMIHDAEQ